MGLSRNVCCVAARIRAPSSPKPPIPSSLATQSDEWFKSSRARKEEEEKKKELGGAKKPTRHNLQQHESMGLHLVKCDGATSGKYVNPQSPGGGGGGAPCKRHDRSCGGVVSTR